ncbi:hypothetical protein C8Q77DRAFT_122944 [Trametes polyzona]|nr:hypothetical protein C8Q77DRAFT_122944 [Trametes polyzona]
MLFVSLKEAVAWFDRICSRRRNADRICGSAYCLRVGARRGHDAARGPGPSEGAEGECDGARRGLSGRWTQLEAALWRRAGRRRVRLCAKSRDRWPE